MKEERTPILALYHRKEIHRPRLSNLLLRPKEPEHLVVPQGGGRLLRDESRGVVQPELEPAGAAGPGADVLADRKEGDAVGCGAEVRADGGDDCVERRVVGGAYFYGCEKGV
jgi:hypothetical protein